MNSACVRRPTADVELLVASTVFVRFTPVQTQQSARGQRPPSCCFPVTISFLPPQPALAGARAPQSVTCYRVPRHPAAKIIERGKASAARGWHSKIIRSIQGTDAATPLGSCFLLFFLHITEPVRTLTVHPQQFARSARPKQDATETKRGATKR